MSRFAREPDIHPDQATRTGVLLINLGTPDAPTPAAVRRYLREFLSDPRVVEIPRLAWQIILHAFVLTTRPRKSAAKYALIWREEGSPLLTWSQKQARLLKGYLGERNAGRPQENPVIALGMRYGNPSIASAMDELKAAGCGRILVLPLYPQYAASTTATAYDAVFKQMARYRNQPELRLVKSFHTWPGYIAALAARVQQSWAEQGRGEHLVLSFHGLPSYTLDKGDPYYWHCQSTARLLATELQLEESAYTVTFQSRFGKTRWLEPYTSVVLTQLAAKGIKTVDVFCPGFVTDCLETLEEIAMEGQQTFIAGGGRTLNHIPCLNENPVWINALADFAMFQLTDW